MNKWERMADKLHKALLKSPRGELTRKEQHRVFSQNCTAAQLDRVTQILVERGVAIVCRRKSKTKPMTTLRIT